MKRGVKMWVSGEFAEFIRSIRREFHLRNDTEATRFIAKRKVRFLKGSLLDFFPFLLILLVFSISSMIGYVLMTNIETTAGPLLSGNESAQALAMGTTTLGYFDDIFVFIMLGLSIAMIVGGFYIKAHPVMMGLGIFILVFVLVVAGVFSNFFIEFASMGEVSSAVSSFSKTIIAWHSMPVLILIIAVVLMIVMYSRPNRESGSGGFV